MDADTSITKPSSFSFAGEHEKWFRAMYAKGIQKTQDILVEKAKKIAALGAEFNALPKLTRDTLTDIASGDVAQWCNSTLSW